MTSLKFWEITLTDYAGETVANSEAILAASFLILGYDATASSNTRLYDPILYHFVTVLTVTVLTCHSFDLSPFSSVTFLAVTVLSSDMHRFYLCCDLMKIMSWRLRLLFQCLVLIPLIIADEHNHIVSEYYAVRA